MSRCARKQSESGTYHVISRGINKENIFRDDFDRKLYIDKLDELLDDNAVSLLAYCLMNNHVHLLIKMNGTNLSSFMRALNSYYASVFNKRHKRVGYLFQNRFKSEPVDDDTYLLTLIRYIHNNPLKAGICEPKDYKWNSYHEYVGEPSHVDTSLTLKLFDSKEDFIRFHTVDGG